MESKRDPGPDFPATTRLPGTWPSPPVPIVSGGLSGAEASAYRRAGRVEADTIFQGVRVFMGQGCASVLAGIHPPPI